MLANAASLDPGEKCTGLPAIDRTLTFWDGSALIGLSTSSFPQKDLAFIMNEILSSGGSITFGQSMITFLASMAHFQLLPDFDTPEKVEQSNFVQALIPGRAGFYS